MHVESEALITVGEEVSKKVTVLTPSVKQWINDSIVERGSVALFLVDLRTENVHIRMI